MSALMLSVAFMGILVVPAPGFGRIPSQLFADMNDINLVAMLLLVLAASLAESYLLMVVPHRWQRLRAKRDKAVEHKLVKKITRIESPTWRKAALIGLPFLPVGGGTLLACGAAHAWNLDAHRTFLGLAALNWMAFALYLFAAQTFGWVIIGLVIAGAVLVSQREQLARLRDWSLRPAN